MTTADRTRPLAGVLLLALLAGPVPGNARGQEPPDTGSAQEGAEFL